MTASRGSVLRLVVVVVVVVVVREAFIRVAAPASAVDLHRVRARVSRGCRDRRAGRERFQQCGRHRGETNRHSPPSLRVRSRESGETRGRRLRQVAQVKPRVRALVKVPIRRVTHGFVRQGIDRSLVQGVDRVRPHDGRRPVHRPAGDETTP